LRERCAYALGRVAVGGSGAGRLSSFVPSCSLAAAKNGAQRRRASRRYSRGVPKNGVTARPNAVLSERKARSESERREITREAKSLKVPEGGSRER